MEISDWLPQLIMFLLLSVNIIKKGKDYPDNGKGTAGVIIACSIVLLILLWGGFFDKLIEYILS